MFVFKLSVYFENIIRKSLVLSAIPRTVKGLGSSEGYERGISSYWADPLPTTPELTHLMLAAITIISQNIIAQRKYESNGFGTLSVPFLV